MKALKWIAGLLGAFIVLVLGIGAILWSRLQPEPPYVQVWYGGRVLTMDEDGTVASAVAMQRDRIVAVGDTEDVAPWLERR